jgi:hypothetical protein
MAMIESPKIAAGRLGRLWIVAAAIICFAVIQVLVPRQQSDKITVTANEECDGTPLSEEDAETRIVKWADAYGFSYSDVESIQLLTFDNLNVDPFLGLADIYQTGTNCAWVATLAGSHSILENADRMKLYIDAIGGKGLYFSMWDSQAPTATVTPGGTATPGPSPTPTTTMSPPPSPTP